MGKDRTPRDTTQQYDPLEPIDIFSLGSSNDPCFGIHHDYLAAECKECGDSEFCAIVKSQGLNKERLELEKKQRFKDLEEADEDVLNKKAKAKELINEYKEKGYKRLKTILLVTDKSGLPKELIKQIYDQN